MIDEQELLPEFVTIPIMLSCLLCWTGGVQLNEWQRHIYTWMARMANSLDCDGT